MMIKDNNIRWVNKEDGMNKGSVMWGDKCDDKKWCKEEGIG